MGSDVMYLDANVTQIEKKQTSSPLHTGFIYA